jgi:hypothetical protein
MAFTALLVEGNLDEAAGRRIVEYAGGTVTETYGKKGAGYIKSNVDGFNQLARGTTILALVDLMDTQSECPVEVIEDWLPHPNKNMIFRLVVREIESWIMADRTGIAQFLGVRKQDIPSRPEQVEDPKRRLVNIARNTRFSRIKRLLVPAPSSTATEGPAYTSEMQQFVRDRWDIERAMERAFSLRRCVRAVQRSVNE